MAENSTAEPACRGRVHVYTGDGKGKTTAALGLVVRAAGAGLRVYFGQFLKDGTSSESDALPRLWDRVTHRWFGRWFAPQEEPGPEDARQAREGLAAARAVLSSGDYDLVVLDEANVAVHFGLFSAEDVIEALDARAQGVEVVLTGRNAPEKLIAYADLVTEMRPLKHYYDQGLEARQGIDK